MIANKEIDIAAKGGFLYAQAMEESSYYEEEKKNVIDGLYVLPKRNIRKNVIIQIIKLPISSLMAILIYLLKMILP